MSSRNLLTELRSPFFQANPVALLVCEPEELRIVGANDAALTLYGYAPRELRHQRLDDLCGTLAQPRAGSNAERRLVAHIARDGTRLLLELKQTPCDLAGHAVVLVAAHKVQDDAERLARSEEILRSLIDECPWGIFRLNLRTGRIEQANEASLRIIGFSLEELASRPPRDLYVHPEDRKRYLDELRQKGRVNHFETRFRTRDGREIPASLTGFLCNDAESGAAYVQTYVVDLTRQRELEEQVAHAHRMEAVGRLAGGIAHDFNNITQSISLACEIALQEPQDAAMESKLQDIMRQAGRAADITRHLLAFSRRQLLQPRAMDLNECIRQAEPLLTRALGVNARLEMELDESIERVFMDHEQLTLALLHLAENARAAMPQGGVLRLRTAAGKRDEHCTVLTVSDNGAGMDEHTRQRIYEPFFTTKKDLSGAGLGLSTVHGIILQSKGRIECTSALGEGTTFRIALPCAKQAPPPRSEAPRHRATARVLLAEDDTIVNKHLTQALVQFGFEVEAVSDGEAALAAFDATRHDLLVTDIIMPRMDGLELTRQLRQRHPEVPVVMISGFNEEGQVLKQISSPTTCYVQKPFAVQKLVDAMRSVLGSAAQIRETSESVQ